EMILMALQQIPNVRGEIMYQYIIRRILISIPMLFALTVIVFGLAKLAPGDAFTKRSLSDPSVDMEVYERQREELGLNDPIPIQYVRWIGDFAQGDFGNSLVFNGRSVAELIQSRLMNTIYLGLFSLFITLIVAI